MVFFREEETNKYEQYNTFKMIIFEQSNIMLEMTGTDSCLQRKGWLAQGLENYGGSQK